jgi:hypothetical protein
MTREATTGRGGVYSHFGPRDTEENDGGILNAGGRKKEVVYKFDYTDVPAYGTDDAIAVIPAGATITKATIRATTNWATGTAMTVGLTTPAGSVIDADGLFTAAALTLANLNLGAVGTGALIGLENQQDVNVVVATTGSAMTAGEATLVVEYLV